MEECRFCDEEFDSEQEMHLHWGEEHSEELNSHQQEKVKKAERDQENQEKQKMQKRKRIAGWGLAGILAIGFFGFVASQMLQPAASGDSQQLDLEGQPAIGPENASVEIVTFEDFKCPFCRQFNSQIQPQLEEDYVDTGKARVYFVNYPLPLGPDSYTAAAASECVYNQDQDEFWKFKKAVFQNQGRESEQWATADQLMQIARDSTEGLNYDELRTCIESEQTMQQVQSDRRLAQNNGVSSTPTVFVNGREVSNPLNYQSLQTVIEQELNN